MFENNKLVLNVCQSVWPFIINAYRGYKEWEERDLMLNLYLIKLVAHNLPTSALLKGKNILQ